MSNPAEQFDRVAAAYATSGVHARGTDLGMLAEMLHPHPEGRVLDLGTGAGHAALAVAPLVGHVYAVDISERMLATAARLATERLVTNISFHPLAVEDVSTLAPALTAGGAKVLLDGAFTRYSAHHWSDPLAALGGTVALLRPGAPFVLIDTVSPESPTLDTILNALELLRDPSHARNARIGEWRARLQAVGFTVEAVHTWQIELDTEEWLTRSATEAWRADACRLLLRQAPGAARETFAIAAEGAAFSLPVALLLARRPA